MRSALALSALLLLLLLPPPSLSQDDAPAESVPQPPAESVPQPPAESVPQPPASANATGTRTTPSVESSTTARAQAPTTSPTATPTAAATTSPTPTSPAPATSPSAQASPTSKVASSPQNPDSPAGAVTTTQGSSTRPAPPTTSASPGNTAVQGGSPPTTRTMTTQGTSVPVSGSPVATATQSPPVASHASSSSPPSDLTTVTGQTPESSPDGQQSHAVVPGASSPASSTGSPGATGMPTTETSSVSAVAPQDIPQGTQQNSSQVSLGPTPSSSTTPLPGGSSRSPSSETVTTPAVAEHTPSSTYLASTTPQGLSTTSSPLAPGKPKVDCVPPEQLDEKLLILNLTGTSPCGKSPPADDKLVTQLCRAVKATFNPAQDACTVQLAPIQKSQAVAIKKITIQTHLLPENVYELLKDKWDDLREVGVSHMQLGDEGPPEEAEDRFSMPLIITIVCMASFLLLVAALYGCCHQRLSQRKDQQRLTEELQTVENGYHDNPTLEVMETSSEMQEKKVVNLNGELGDSWIVPLDNLTKDDLDEEDTHL